MKVHIITIIIIAILFSGCTALEKSPVLYITLNITDNESVISLDDGKIDMELVNPLKVQRQDQSAPLPQISMLGYANRDIVTYLAARSYTGEGTYTFTAPVIEDKVPKYNDTLAFEIRIYNETSGIGRVYFYAKWRWNETE
ncbi:MAG: hypothetical protein KAJ03_06485 [Gammaproteobacteria bacterium]|nr:hypothetical protein [Gammaproteobacteria bacterium]